MTHILKPIPFFITCIVIFTLSAIGAYVDAKDLINYGNEFGSMFANAFSLLINVALLFVLIFAVLKYLWAKRALIIILYVFLANHVLDIFISLFANTDPSNSIVAGLIVGAILVYLHTSASLKQAFPNR